MLVLDVVDEGVEKVVDEVSSSEPSSSAV